MNLRVLSILLCLAAAATRNARAGDAPEMNLEQGVLEMEIFNDLNKAKARFRDVINDKNSAHRLSAEALWEMAECYRRQGGDDAALFVLKKVVSDFPNTQPFAKAAADLAVDLSRDLDGDPESPNSADDFVSRDLARILRAALTLNETQEAASTARELLDVYNSIIFELSLSSPDELPEVRRDRAAVLQDFQKFQHFTAATLASLQSGSAKSVLTQLDKDLLMEMEDRSDLYPGDFNIDYYAARDAITAALETGNSEKVASAAAAFRTLLEPIAAGPSDLAITIAVTGHCNAARVVADLCREHKPGDALRAWRQSSLTGLGSGVTGAGLVIEDVAAIPPILRARFLAALVHLESALYSLLSEEDHKRARKELQVAISKLEILKGSDDSPAFAARVDKSIQRMKEADALLVAGEVGRAEEVMRSEMYVTR